MGNFVYIIIAAVIVFIFFLLYSEIKQKDKWVDDGEFQRAKAKMQRHCSEADFISFMDFLKSYKGGYVRRSQGKIITQEYKGSEKGELKGIFYNVVLTNRNLSIAQKEEFRKFLISIGVTGVDRRPSYETRDSKLNNKEKDEDNFQRKEVGNQGEKAVRDILNTLNRSQYNIINGPKLKVDETLKEFDHIVVGENGFFVIETKAFGMSEGKASKASLMIAKGDKWTVKKYDRIKELKSPTQQVLEEKELLEKVIEIPIEIHPILVLSNPELSVIQKMELPYKVLKVDELKDYIESSQDKITENDKMEILQNINKSRVN